VLIDIDHVPLDLLSSDILTAGTPRPYTPALATMLVLIAAAGLLRRRRGATAVAGLAVGVGLHLLRDVATGPVALWWPVTAHGLQVGYGWYAAGLVLATIAGALRCDRWPVTAR
jgi:inner membrane protein